MGTFSYTAQSSSTIGYARSNSTTWNTGTSNGAMQGIYTTGTASSGLSRVGIMVFSGLGDAVNGKTITGIGLAFKCAASGYDNNSKVLGLYKARWQYINTGISGAQQVGDAIGNLTGHFYNATVSYNLSASSTGDNLTVFNNMKTYFESGNSALVCYSGESSKGGSHNYSYNYLKITTAAITVTYLDAGIVKYYTGSTWQDCNAYYYDDSAWKLVAPYYYDGSAWKLV